MATRRKKRRGFENRAVIYMRYSTKNQTDLSIEYQQHECEAYCAAHGYEVVKRFIDEAQSGTTDKRKAFNDMITEAQNEPQWDRVIVYNNSRFARNVEDSFYYRVMLKKLGITVESTKESNDDTPEANLTRNIGMSFDAYLPEKTAEHTHSSMASLARDCKHCGGTPPLGYDVKKRKLAINEYEAETVRMIFDMYSKGYSYNDMMKVLDAEGRTTKSGNPFKKTSFNSILQQEKYKGIYVWNRASARDFDDMRNNHESKPISKQIRVEHGCPAIVSEELFDRVQQRMKDNRRANKSESGKYHYMLGSMQKVYCAECGALMVGGSYKSHGTAYRYYVCPNHKLRTCSTKNIRALYLERYIAVTIVKNILTKKNYEQYNDLMIDVVNGRSCEGLKKELKRIDRAINSLMKAIEKCPADELMERFRVLLTKKQGLQNRIDEAMKVPAITVDNYKDTRNQMARELKNSLDPIVREIIANIIEKITVSNDGIEIKLNI